MTLSELLHQLNELNLSNAGTDVVTRGSAPHTMVDVTDVRVVKTTNKRKVIYIGKPKAPKAD